MATWNSYRRAITGRVLNLAFVAALPGLVAGALGQDTRATVSGTVFDPSGAVVVGVTLKLLNVETGVLLTTTSNDAGSYRFPFLVPGNYRLSAEHPGFRTFVRENLVLNVAQAAVVDVTLLLGQSAESVTISSDAPLLEAERADRGLVIDNRTVVDMPLNIRNPIMLAALSPGIIHTSGTQHLNPFSNSGISSWSINGGRAVNNEFFLDGAPNNTLYNRNNNIAYVPAVDAVEEFKVMANSYDAQYGRTGGGVINVSIKSGTNQFHGSAYEFLKRTWLNANTFANNAKKAPRQGNALDQYGFSLGGPVWLPKLYHGKDRSFFFFAFEKYREDTYYPSKSISSVPTALQRQGDFSRTFDNANRLLVIYDPLTGRTEGGRWVRSPFAGNRIPPDRINPVAANIVNHYPLPNTTTPGSVDWQNNFFLNPNIGRFDFITLTARADHNLSQRWRMYGRFSYSDFTQLRLTNGIPGVAGDYRSGGKFFKGGVLDAVATLNPRTVLNLRAALNRWEEALGPHANEGFTSAQLGWPQRLVSRSTISLDTDLRYKE